MNTELNEDTKFNPETKFNLLEDAQARYLANETRGVYKPADYQGGKRAMERGRTAIFQARLVYKQLLPLVVASGVCWLIGLTIFLWWKPASRRRTSSGYLRDR
jgi:hypothetical protein